VTELTAAPFWRRLLADLLDLTLIAGVVYGLWTTGAIAPNQLPSPRYDWIDYAANLAANHLPALTPTLIAIPTVGITYGLLCHGLAGRTLGELLLGLRLVTKDGGPPGPLRALLHAVGTLLGVALLLLGYMWAAVGHTRQTLAEGLSGTLLIAGRPRSAR
jgi:uncharacterized RDD family membrane protein YckC